VLAPQISMRERMSMYNGNALKIGLFGANCSSGRAVTRVPERWSGNWLDNLRLARMADDAGLDFLLPIARWKGYGGDTDYQGATLETVNWASGLLASTRRITVFGTVHAPLFNPIIAAKEFVTADHIGEGRFGLNLVVGWNEDEFDMFGVQQREHDERYDYAQEWVEVMKMAWSDREQFDFAGKYFNLKGVRAKPKPFGGTRPVMMNAGASDVGRAFALRNCEAFFTNASRHSRTETENKVRAVKAEAEKFGREIDVYTVGVVTCRPTRKDAEERYRYCGRRAGRLVGGRPDPGEEEHHQGQPFPRGLHAQAHPIRQRHGRPARRRGPRRGCPTTCRAEPGGPARHRHLLRQLRG